MCVCHVLKHRNYSNTVRDRRSESISRYWETIGWLSIDTTVDPLTQLQPPTTMTDMMTLACSTCRITMEQGGGDAASWSILFLLVIIVDLIARRGARGQHVDGAGWQRPLHRV